MTHNSGFPRGVWVITVSTVRESSVDATRCTQGVTLSHSLACGTVASIGAVSAKTEGVSHPATAAHHNLHCRHNRSSYSREHLFNGSSETGDSIFLLASATTFNPAHIYNSTSCQKTIVSERLPRHHRQHAQSHCPCCTWFRSLLGMALDAQLLRTDPNRQPPGATSSLSNCRFVPRLI